ncbi:MAG TPA: hypothetical protein VJQ56_05270, partial [Blastocatellia bacterium]|nr:hypothetical protein [Blastocatellia bacterium]
ATHERQVIRGEATVNNIGAGLLSSLAILPEDALFLDQRFNNATTEALISPAVGGGPAFAEGVGQLFVVPPLGDLNGDGIPDSFLFEGEESLFAPLAIVGTANGGRRTIRGGEAIRLVRTDSTTDNFITRVDYNLTDNDRLTGRYIWARGDFPLAVGRFLAGAIFDVPNTNHNLGVTYTKTLSSRVVNEARFNFSRLDVAFGDTSELPATGISFTGGTRSISGLGLFTFGTQNNLPQSRVVDTYQFQDSVTATIGNHGLRFGADIRRQNTENFFLPNFLGTNEFRSGGTLPANTFFNASGTARTTATQFENFVLGRPARINFALGEPQYTTTQNDYFFFVQDDWRVRPNLTLNLGLRYEVSTSPFNPLIEQLNEREADPQTAIFDPSFPLEFRTANRLPLDKNNFGPRVGFAWSPNFDFLGERFTNGRTVIRGGFGIAYDPPFFNIVSNTVTAAPFAAAGQIRQTPGAVGSVPFPFNPQDRSDLALAFGTNGGDPRLFNQTRVDPNLYNPYTISWNVGVQQELFRGSVLEVRYVASRIRGQFQTVNSNPDLSFLAQAGQFLRNDPGAFTNGIVAPGATEANGFNNRPGTTGNGRLDPNFGPVRLRTNGASSNYDGLQVRFDARVRNQLTLNANYTWSKTIDNASEIFGTFGGGQALPHSQDPFNTTGAERGLSAFHRKHNFTAGYLWDLPFFTDQRGLVGKALGGWQLNGIIEMRSGQPWNPIVFLGNYDPSWDTAFTTSVSASRPFAGNPDAPISTIAFGSTANWALFETGDAPANPFGSYIVYDTRNPGSAGTVVGSLEEARQQARVIYNDFGLLANGIPLDFLDAFQDFGTPFGDLGRNTLLGEPTFLTNMSLFKNIKLTETKALEFRVEAFNIFNHRNFGVGDPITEDAVGASGVVGTYANPGFNNGGSRTMRLGIRFLF